MRRRIDGYVETHGVYTANYHIGASNFDNQFYICRKSLTMYNFENNPNEIPEKRHSTLEKAVMVFTIIGVIITAYAVFYKEDKIVIIKGEERQQQEIPAAAAEPPETAQKTVESNTINIKPSKTKARKAIQLFKKGEYKKIGIIATNEVGYDSSLGQRIAAQLGSTASYTVILDDFVQQGFFRKVAKGDLTALASAQAQVHMKYMLMVSQGAIQESKTDKSSLPTLQREMLKSESMIQSSYQAWVIDVAANKEIKHWQGTVNEPSVANTPKEDIVRVAIARDIAKKGLGIN